MKRRHLLTSSALSLTGAVGLKTRCANAQDNQQPIIGTTGQPMVQWQMATSWPKSLQVLFDSAELLCQLVNKMTDGNFVITPYPAGELAGGLEVLSAVQSATVACGHTASYYYLDQSNALAFGTTLPFGLNAAQQDAWLYYGGGLEAMQSVYAALGVINFPGGNTGAQMGGWFKRQVNTVQDFAGLNMRVPGLGGKILERLGVKIHNLSGDQIFAALEDGTIDAAEWKNPHADKTLGLDRVAPYYYYPGWWEPGTSYEFQVNLAEWNKLPTDYQEIFKTAAAGVNSKMLARFNALNGDVLNRLLIGGTKLLPFSQEILEASYQAAFELYEDIASTDDSFNQIYQSWKAFRSDISQWSRINELSLAEFVMSDSVLAKL
ncbi:MAG: ABC transporter substrate-binding protein [Phormidesmis sp. RL_2_1]|nr:ABC transporter substrate-binding protein [Phormidesmis sp. RL_2_1]